MGFKAIRYKAIDCLKAGRIQAEERSDISTKNLLKTGEMSADDVITLLKVTKGDQYRNEPHKDDKNTMVRFFEPYSSESYWHIKLYFLDPDCWFISVHKSFKKTKRKKKVKYGNLQRRR